MRILEQLARALQSGDIEVIDDDATVLSLQVVTV